MAGTLVITTLSDGTNSTSATNPILGSAKAWINFDGAGASIRASYNVSSVTRNGVGDYTINFTNALSDNSYAALVTAGGGGVAAAGNALVGWGAGNSYTTTSLSIGVSDNNTDTNSDSSLVNVSIFR